MRDGEQNGPSRPAESPQATRNRADLLQAICKLLSQKQMFIAVGSLDSVFITLCYYGNKLTDTPDTALFLLLTLFIKSSGFLLFGIDFYKFGGKFTSNEMI